MKTLIEGMIHDAGNWKCENGLLIFICDPGIAKGCYELRNRGLDLTYEITIWPSRQHYRMTTGAEFMGMGEPEPVQLNQAEKKMCAILGLTEFELGTFLRSWTPEQPHPADVQQMNRELTRAGNNWTTKKK